MARMEAISLLRWAAVVFSSVYMSSDALLLKNETVVWTTGKSDFLRSENIWDFIDDNIGSPTISSKGTAYSKFTDVSHHYKKGLLLFTDAALASIYGLNANHANYDNFAVLFTGTSQKVGQVCVDWHNDNFYWTDSLFGWIGMKQLPDTLSVVNSLHSGFKVIVDNPLDEPSGLAVHPHRRFLFWSDIGDQVKIERSDLLGETRTLIVWKGLLRPSVLTLDIDHIDPSKDILYWSDQVRGTVEFSALDGSNRKILIARENTAYFGLAVFRDRILVTILGENMTTFIRKGSENVLTTEDGFRMDYPMELMTVYTDSNQKEASRNPCDVESFHCDQLCVDMGDNQAPECRCEDGFIVSNRVNCRADTNVLERQILYTNDTDICRTSINTLHSHVLITPTVDCSVVRHTRNITRFAVNSHRKLIFFTDGNVIYEVEAFRNTFQTLYNTTASITDMDHDWLTEKVYWTEPDNRQIMSSYTVANGILGAKVEVSDTRATKIAVDPHNGQLFWISEDGIVARLMKRSKDGIVSEINTGSASFDPTDLEFDRRSSRLWWHDGNKKHVVSVKTDGSDEKILPSLNGHRKHSAVTVFKRFVLLSTVDDNTTMMDVGVVEDGEITHQFMFNPGLPFSSLRDVHAVATSLQPMETVRCEQNNGGCQHICLPEGDQHCTCRLGYHLASDGRSCISRVLDRNFALVTDTMFNTILQVDLTTSEVHAISIHSDNNVTSAVMDTLSAFGPRVVWIDRGSKSVKEKILTGLGEKSLGIDVSVDSYLSVDVSTGYIYVTTGNKIILITPKGDTKTIVEDLQGTPRHIIVVRCDAWKIVWSESSGSGNHRIVRAEMDGTNVKGVVDLDSEPLAIAVEDSTRDNPYVYWSTENNGRGTIARLHLGSLTGEEILMSVTGLIPTSMDVLGDHIYFISRGQRVITRINKNDGSGMMTLASMPDVGIMSTLGLDKPQSSCNSRCDPCTNGGCSTICLSSSSGRVCVCPDGVDLGDDAETCTNVKRCPLHPGKEVASMAACCLPVSKSECSFTCAKGYVHKVTSVTCMSNPGRWNVTSDKMCSSVPTTTDGTAISLGPVVGGAVGGVAAVVILAVVIVICRRRMSSRKQTDRLPSQRYLNGYTPEPRQLSGEYNSPEYADNCRTSPGPSLEEGSNGSSIFNPRYRSFPARQLPARQLTARQLPPTPTDDGEYMELDEATEDRLREGEIASAYYTEDDTYLKAIDRESTNGGYLTALQTTSIKRF